MQDRLKAGLRAETGGPRTEARGQKSADPGGDGFQYLKEAAGVCGEKDDEGGDGPEVRGQGAEVSEAMQKPL